MAPLSLAHLSDPHLSYEAIRLRPRDYVGKRLLSRLSWRRDRHRKHRPEVLDAVVADIRAQAPDEILVTGDLTNLATPAEFAHAATWLRHLGDPAHVSVVPGNHDALVRAPWEESFALWRPWMAPDKAAEDGAAFPYLRVRGGVAIIGLSSAVPTPPFLATGRVGMAQRERLRRLLAETGEQGLFRLVLVHHPLADGVVSRRKSLTDAAGVRDALAEAGAELVLWGHAHQAGLYTVPGPHEPIPALGAASASRLSGSDASMACWHHLLIEPAASAGWQVKVTVRRLHPEGGMRTAGSYVLRTGPRRGALRAA
jgi:3',5'-cyclic AMP phosphodiesterase CpdA